MLDSLRAHADLAQAHTAKVRPFSPSVIAQINKRAAQLWFSGICFSIVSSLYKLRDLSIKVAKARRVGSKEKEAERRDALRTVLA